MTTHHGESDDALDRVLQTTDDSLLNHLGAAMVGRPSRSDAVLDAVLKAADDALLSRLADVGKPRIVIFGPMVIAPG